MRINVPAGRAAVALAFLVAACGGDATAPGEEAVPCEATTNSVEASVAVGQAVVFDWTPACEVALLLVEPTGSGHDLWAVSVDDAEANGIAPPVTYGVLPEGAESSSAAEPLISGQRYELILWRVMPNGSAVLLTVHEFTR
ncbi:MAG TPA: hypothetical protein VML95_05945 [Longimicrobiales bacterium]|nr:hypothetical protein [Longimicrobiales bacterium]